MTLTTNEMAAVMKLAAQEMITVELCHYGTRIGCLTYEPMSKEAEGLPFDITINRVGSQSYDCMFNTELGDLFYEMTYTGELGDLDANVGAF